MQKLDKSKLVMNLGKRYKLVPFLDKALATFDDPWEFKYEPKKGDTGWHPSGQCTPPVSDLYQNAKPEWDDWKAVHEGQAQYAGPQPGPPIKAELRKTFMVGHYWHQLLQHLCLELNFCEPSAVERKGERGWSTPICYYTGGGGDGVWLPKPFHWATGSGDIAPCTLPNGWEGVVDFKTMSAQQYKQPDIPQWAAAKYKCQINIYMDFFDLENGIILCVNKDAPHDFKEFEFQRDQGLIDAIYAKWEFVSECLNNDIEITEADDNHFLLPL